MRLSDSQRSFARQLRRDQTDAERRLWHLLRGRRFRGLRFRRQHPVGPYFADFACLEIGLVIELDGSQHAAIHARVYDGKRTAFLCKQGFEVIRFWDNDVLNNTQGVLQAILNVVQRRETRPSAQSCPASSDRERG
jgi:adenine-specific DNA-methyltransferase